MDTGLLYFCYISALFCYHLATFLLYFCSLFATTTLYFCSWR
jgi:hypothetical protein